VSNHGQNARMKSVAPIRQFIPVPSEECRPRRPKISVIIPTLNEASVIATTLRHIPRGGDVELIVVDGSSHDGTVAIAEASGARVIRTASNRAQQMNAGAAIARGEILLFLHADTRLPADFARAVHTVLSRPKVVAGAYRLRIDSPRWSLRVVEALANFRSRWLKMPYGDQALFLRARHFRTAVGFSNLPIMEDFEFVRRLGRWGRIAIAPAVVVTSARRWEKLGVLRTTLLNQVIILAYLLGVAPARLARWYRSAGRRARNSPQEARKGHGWLRHIRLAWRARTRFGHALSSHHRTS
jgi:rSAM/selenodomain-associated transferase 2